MSLIQTALTTGLDPSTGIPHSRKSEDWKFSPIWHKHIWWQCLPCTNVDLFAPNSLWLGPEPHTLPAPDNRATLTMSTASPKPHSLLFQGSFSAVKTGRFPLCSVWRVSCYQCCSHWATSFQYKSTSSYTLNHAQHFTTLTNSVQSRSEATLWNSLNHVFNGVGEHYCKFTSK